MPPFGGPRQKFRRQLEQEGRTEAEIQRILNETFGPDPGKPTNPPPKTKKTKQPRKRR